MPKAVVPPRRGARGVSVRRGILCEFRIILSTVMYAYPLCSDPSPLVRGRLERSASRITYSQVSAPRPGGDSPRAARRARYAACGELANEKLSSLFHAYSVNRIRCPTRNRSVRLVNGINCRKYRGQTINRWRTEGARRAAREGAVRSIEGRDALTAGTARGLWCVVGEQLEGERAAWDVRGLAEWSIAGTYIGCASRAILHCRDNVYVHGTYKILPDGLYSVLYARLCTFYTHWYFCIYVYVYISIYVFYMYIYVINI